MLRREGEVFLFGTAMAGNSFRRNQPKSRSGSAHVNSTNAPLAESSGAAHCHARTI
jgi:hypothetical protein